MGAHGTTRGQVFLRAKMAINCTRNLSIWDFMLAYLVSFLFKKITHKHLNSPSSKDVRKSLGL